MIYADMEIVHWKTDRPQPYPGNARKITQKAIDKVAASIKEFDWRQPIVVDSEGVVVAGHTRLLAAKKMGLEHVPVHIAAELTPEQCKAYRLMDNRSNDEAEWDLDLLRPELASLAEMNFDLDLTGFDPNELSPADPPVKASGASEKGGRLTTVELTEPQVYWLIKLLDKAKEPPRARASYNAMRRKFDQAPLTAEAGE